MNGSSSSSVSFSFGAGGDDVILAPTVSSYIQFFTFLFLKRFWDLVTINLEMGLKFRR